MDDKHLLVNAFICSDRIYTIPAKKVGKFLINQKSDERFHQSRDVTQDKLQLVLIELMKANTQALNNKNNTQDLSKEIPTHSISHVAQCQTKKS